MSSALDPPRACRPRQSRETSGRCSARGRGIIRASSSPPPAPTTVPPSSQLDLFRTIPELFNLCDKYQCPGIVLADLLISEGTASVDPAELKFDGKIDRGELILPNGKSETQNPFGGYNDNAYLRYKNTASGISPRAVPGV